MKILITSDWYKPVINGVVTSITSLYDGLTSMGHDVRILTLSGNAHSHVSGPVTYIGSVGVGKIYPNARLKTAPSSHYIKDLVSWNPDIIHSQCEFSTFFLARRISELCRCPLVHTYHTVYEDFTHYFSPSIRFGKYMASTLSRKILGKTNAVIVPTSKIKDMLIRYGITQPIFIVPSGLELDKFHEQISREELDTMRSKFHLFEKNKVLVYLGRMGREKNIEELLMLLHNQNLENLRLFLVGDGPFRPQLEEKVKRLNLSNQVIFTGMVQPDEVVKYYKLGDIFVSASNSETQGLTYIEAMAAGLPLLCKEDPCLDDVITNGVNGFTYHDCDDFRHKLLHLLSDDRLRLRIGEAARDTVEKNYSALGFSEKILSVYRNQLRISEDLDFYNQKINDSF